MGGSEVPDVDPRVTVQDCTAQVGAIVQPVTNDVTLTCSPAASGGISVAAGAGDRGFVAYDTYGARPSRMATIEIGKPISLEQGPTAARDVQVATDASGAPYLVGDQIPNVRLACYRLDPTGWSRETIVPPPVSYEALLPGTNFRFAADGRAFLAYYPIQLATRAAPGGWVLTPVPGASTAFGLAVDSLDRPHVISETYSMTGSNIVGLADWSPGLSESTLASSLKDSRYYPSAARVDGGRIGAALLTVDSIRVAVQQANGSPTVRALPSTSYLNVTGCPPLPPSGGTRFPPTPCTETGDGVIAKELTATADGLWLSYLFRHVDRDAVQECRPFETTNLCLQTTTSDRSTAEVVVVRIPTDAASSPTVVWRSPIPGNPYATIAVDGRNSRLAIAVAWTGSLSLPMMIRYLMIDTTRLPSSP